MVSLLGLSIFFKFVLFESLHTHAQSHSFGYQEDEYVDNTDVGIGRETAIVYSFLIENSKAMRLHGREQSDK